MLTKAVQTIETQTGVTILTPPEIAEKILESGTEESQTASSSKS
jgi:hypothetical protein